MSPAMRRSRWFVYSISAILSAQQSACGPKSPPFSSVEAYTLTVNTVISATASVKTQRAKDKAILIHHCKNDERNSRKAPWVTPQTVTVRSVPWCGAKGMLPLQIYHGLAIRPHPDQTRTDSLSSSSSYSSHSPSNNNNATKTSLLSVSSRILQEKYHSLSSSQRQRLSQKVSAEARASRALSAPDHLHILYRDTDVCVVHKPSGILCVPGPRRNPSLVHLVHESLHMERNNNTCVDRMVVHRLDMDTSGVVVFALHERALRVLHEDFRERRIQKTYRALVCGHVPVSEGELDVPLERDPDRLPFVRVARNQHTNNEYIHHQQQQQQQQQRHKFLTQAPKPSRTSFRVLSWEHLDGCPVTRLELVPHTGRTHQLRVHCAAMGHPIVGDSIYGLHGEGSPHGGLDEASLAELFPHRATWNLQHRLARQKPRRLCLHAQQLCLHHPLTGAPMMFCADADF